MTVLITLTTAGYSTGPFSLYSDVGAYATPFEVGVSKSSLVAGYTSSLVPDGTTIVRVQSTGVCNTQVDLTIVTTTTTTTTTTSTTTTTTSTTSTTTTLAPSNYLIERCGDLALYNTSKLYAFNLGDVVQFQVGTPGAGTIYCGTIIDTDYAVITDATLYSGISYTCDDEIHCNI